MRKLFILMLWLTILTVACSKKAVSPPSKASLTFPLQNELCTQGTIISATQSSLVFKWTATTNTDHYIVTLTDLVTGTATTQTATTNQLAIVLLRNTPYSWNVTSVSAKIKFTCKKRYLEILQRRAWRCCTCAIPGRNYFAHFWSDSYRYRRNRDAELERQFCR